MQNRNTMICKIPTVRSGSAAATLRSVSLTGPAGRLEALLNEGAASAPVAALVCHPHPVGGGSMHNKVVFHAMKALNTPEWGLNWPVLRFNFRGTGLSQGVYDGDAEAGDVLAALDWLDNRYHKPLVVVGFSFGAVMALAACCSSAHADCLTSPVFSASPVFPASKLRALVALGLPISAMGRDYLYPNLQNCIIPKLFLSGDKDQYAPAIQLVQLLDSAAEPKRLVLIPGADHFFTGQLEPMQCALSAWLEELS
jgi:alpha/beta superfamily hydrolase